MSETEFFWLLEGKLDDGTVIYFKGKGLHSGRPEYTTDANEARKFQGKEDAEAHNNSPWHKYVPMEHGFG